MKSASSMAALSFNTRDKLARQYSRARARAHAILCAALWKLTVEISSHFARKERRATDMKNSRRIYVAACETTVKISNETSITDIKDGRIVEKVHQVPNCRIINRADRTPIADRRYR